jgi:hypothetical protein
MAQTEHRAMAARALAQVRTTEHVAQSRVMFSVVGRLVGAAACFAGFTVLALFGGAGIVPFFMCGAYALLVAGFGLASTALFRRGADGRVVFFTRNFDDSQQR